MAVVAAVAAVGSAAAEAEAAATEEAEVAAAASEAEGAEAAAAGEALEAGVAAVEEVVAVVVRAVAAGEEEAASREANKLLLNPTDIPEYSLREAKKMHWLQRIWCLDQKYMEKREYPLRMKEKRWNTEYGILSDQS